MKASLNRIASFFLVFVFSGCSDKYDILPTDVAFGEYSFSQTDCEWMDLSYPHDSEVVIINSYEELERYCTYDEIGSLPVVDFSTHTLLLARGVELYNNRASIKSLQQLSIGTYVMHVELDMNLAAVITNWQVAISTKKLAVGDRVLLRVVRAQE